MAVEQGCGAHETDRAPGLWWLHVTGW
jgi:hypothetical protein